MPENIPYPLAQAVWPSYMVRESRMAFNEGRRPVDIVRPQDVPIDLPVPSVYAHFTQIILPEVIAVTLAREFRAKRLELAHTVRDRERALEQPDYESEQFV